jgi:hypothetical protein
LPSPPDLRYYIRKENNIKAVIVSNNIERANTIESSPIALTAGWSSIQFHQSGVHIELR